MFIPICRPQVAFFHFAMLLLLLLPQASYAAPSYEEIYVNVYTPTGEYLTVWNPTTQQAEPDPNNPVIKEESGTLFLNKGFIPAGNRIVNAKALGISVATLNDIKGKYVMSLNTWVSLNNVHGDDTALKNFPRSTATYDFNGVPYVTVTVKGTNNPTDPGTGTNTGNICSSTVVVITPGNPTVTVAVPQPNAAETGPITGRFQINLDAPRSRKTVVGFTLSGSAQRGKDYKGIKTTVDIPAGTTSAYVDITPINDKKKETTETVVLTLRPSGSYAVGTTNSGTVNIADND